ncbi:unnamed protein product [Toxocara canis]|uniref:POU-specific atypical domain-containing protein n=1 Tax=Toxocara canis TaxID=6265 RepID=A0A183UIJ7_TOXCA|nr:unnamed protein product [Toxocara canis]
MANSSNLNPLSHSVIRERHREPSVLLTAYGGPRGYFANHICDQYPKEPPVPVTINASSSPVVAASSPERCSVQTVPLASTAGAPSAGTDASPVTIPPTCIFGQYNFDGSSPSSCRPIRSQRTPMREITTLDDPSELDEFMQQGEEGCIQDMKQFITQFSLRQTTVAMMTGIW